MSKIHKLSDNLINLIAAGEVVERPASVVKELLENAIDAKSTNITIKLKNYGLEQIEISDNGVGMTSQDALMAFEQHATSKISSESDLESILSLGFRGEALPSIKSVSESIIIDTKSENSDASRFEIKALSNTTFTSSKIDTGTTIQVNNIFGNVPARKKFLKSDSTELRQIINIFLNIALVHLGIHFELHHEDKLLYRLTQTNEITDRLFEIYGKLFVDNLLPKAEYISANRKITAYIIKPFFAKKSNPVQLMYINNRFVIEKTIQAAINQAYRGFIHRDLKPSFLVFIELDPKEVDINVHPRKLEAKFVNSGEIFSLVHKLVRSTLEKETKQALHNSIKNEELKENQEIRDWKLESSDPKLQTHSSRSMILRDTSNTSYKPSSKKSQVNQAMLFTQELLNSPTHDLTINGSTSSNYYIYYQLFNTYILFERNNKLIVVDQHAAAEKILFEKLISEFGDIKTKPLLIPTVVPITENDKTELLSKSEDLQRIGMVINDFGPGSIQITEIPEYSDLHDIEDLIDEILEPNSQFQQTFEDFRLSNDAISEKIYYLIATTACHGSIRAGQSLSKEEMTKIVNDLLKLDNPYNCPHGRPVYWEIEKSDIEKNFKRIV